MKKEVIVVPYDPSWPQTFQELKKVYQEVLVGLLLDIQHVGSTSVPGLAAKPKIDIDLVVENEIKKEEVIRRLEELGYVHVGDLGIAGREAFKRPSDKVPFHKNERSWPLHNLYVCIEGIPAVLNHLLFRDYLRQQPETAEAYGQLKKALAKAHPDDIDAYVEKKTAFIIEVLRKAGFPQQELKAIIEQNKAPG